MGFAQWFWRLFLVFTGIIVAHVLIVTLVAAAHGGSAPVFELWATALVMITVGAAAVWYCVRRIITPLAELASFARTCAGQGRAGALQAHADVTPLTGAFMQLQRDMASRLAQIQNNHE